MDTNDIRAMEYANKNGVFPRFYDKYCDLVIDFWDMVLGSSMYEGSIFYGINKVFKGKMFILSSMSVDWKANKKDIWAGKENLSKFFKY